MQRSSFPWVWLLLAAILLLVPGTAGRLFLDVLGGMTLLLLLLPLLAAGAGFLAWQGLRSRFITCSACGTTSFGTEVCPACGTPLTVQAESDRTESGAVQLEPSQVTIDVEAVDVSPASDGDSRTSSPF